MNINSIVGHSLDSAAEAASVSIFTITHAVREGELSARRIANQAVILTTDLQTWLEGQPDWNATKSPAA